MSPQIIKKWTKNKLIFILTCYGEVDLLVFEIHYIDWFKLFSRNLFIKMFNIIVHWYPLSNIWTSSELQAKTKQTRILSMKTNIIGKSILRPTWQIFHLTEITPIVLGRQKNRFHSISKPFERTLETQSWIHQRELVTFGAKFVVSHWILTCAFSNVSEINNKWQKWHLSVNDECDELNISERDKIICNLVCLRRSCIHEFTCSMTQDRIIYSLDVKFNSPTSFRLIIRTPFVVLLFIKN